MSDETPRLRLPDMPETPELYPDLVADAFTRIDAFTDLYLKGRFVNTPPSAPADGDAYLTGGSPTGAWSGQPYKIAACRDGGWTILTPFNGLRAYVAMTGGFIVYEDGLWRDCNALIGGAEGSIASAATCDIGAAASLLLAVTGTTAITSFGAAASTLRFLRFAGALTLTHHAASLILPGGADIVTAAGDTAIFASDASGNWRCRVFTRADGRMTNMASPLFTGAVGIGATGGASGLNVNRPFASGYGQISVTASDTYGYLSLDGPNGSGAFLKVAGVTKWEIGAWASRSGALVFQQAGAGEAACFDASGNFCAGATASTYGHRIVAAGGTSQGLLASTSEAANDCIGLWNKASSGNNLFCSFYTEGSITPRGSVSFNRASGVVAYNTTSDARLKTVASRQRDYRGAIRALWVGDFTWNENGAPGFGVLAQQAYGVMPNRQGVTPPARADGDWHAAAEPFAHLALWGVKDLYAMIEALAARVAALEAAHAG